MRARIVALETIVILYKYTRAAASRKILCTHVCLYIYKCARLFLDFILEIYTYGRSTHSQQVEKTHEVRARMGFSGRGARKGVDF